jgi:vacuole morphology and inheritance protein 14
MPPGTDGDTLLTQVVLRGIGDKLYDKRKAAALEVEQLVKNLAREVCGPPGPAAPCPRQPSLSQQGQARPVTADLLPYSLLQQGNWSSIVQILDRLTEDYAYSPQANCRKGGLLALAAAAVALAERKQVPPYVAAVHACMCAW